MNLKDRHRSFNIQMTMAQVKPKVKNKYHCFKCNYEFILPSNASGYSNTAPKSFMEAADRNSYINKQGGQYRKNHSRIPLLMKCGHSICERCLRRDLDIAGFVKCNICSEIEKFVIKQNDKEMYIHFPINYYLMGLMVMDNTNLDDIFKVNSKISNEKLTPPKLISGQSQSSSGKKPLCNECRTIKSECSCIDCKLTLCKGCFNFIHRIKSFNHHKLEPLNALNVANQFNSLNLPNCTIHTQRDQPLEFYCVDCKNDACNTCILTIHLGHKFLELTAINKEYLSVLKEKQADVQSMKTIFENLIKKVECKLKNVGDKPKNIETIQKKIEQHFFNIFARLQLTENKLRKKLYFEQNKNIFTLEQIHEDLTKDLKMLNEILDLCSLESNSTYFPQVNVLKLLEKFKCLAENKKEYLIENSKQENIKFNIDESILTMIDQHCSLECGTEKVFQLVSLEELPENYVSPNSSINNSTSDLSIQGVDDGCLSASQSIDEISVQSLYSPRNKLSNKKSELFTDEPKKPLVEGACVTVYMSHIKNPSLFYVQHVSDAYEHFELSHLYSQHAQRTSQPDDIELYQLYLVHFENDGLWYRGRIQSIKENSNKEKDYEVFFIDYGNTKIVTIEKLRAMPQNWKSVPPKAICCSLFDIVPRDDDWNDEATKCVLRLIAQSNVNLVIMSIVNQIYQVDLLTIPKNNLEIRTSIRDALIFLEYGCFAKEIKCSKLISMEMENSKYHFHQLHKDDIVNIKCSCIIHPTKFYVQLSNYSNYFNKLSTQMQDKYTKSGKKGKIFTPRVGMICAVLFKDVWYRGLITNLPGNKTIDVKLVDYGKKVQVYWENIRILLKEFQQLNVQAVKCKLSDIDPLVTSVWTDESVKYFKNLVENANLKMQINLVDTIYKVTLFKIMSDYDLNINTEMVETKFAISTGPNSQVHKIIIQSPILLKKESNLQKNENKLIKPTVLNEPGEPVRVLVTVLNAISPGRIYVRPDDRNKVIHELDFNLLKFYENTSYDSTINWSENDICVTKIKDKWYRAIIEKIENDNSIHVFMKDYAIQEIVNKTLLRPFSKEFSSFRDGSMKCKLYGVKAAGDKNEWPMLACEELRDLISGYSDIYITKRGNITEDRALPIDMWVQHVKLGGALEPSTTSWLLINQVLIEKGLVIPIKNPQQHELLEALTKNELEETKATSNISSISNDIVDESSINDWNALTEMENLPLTSQQTHWNSPTFPEKKIFRAYVTHIDDDMSIYLYDVNVQITVDSIQKTLDFHFQNSSASAEDMFWRTNQLCIVKDKDTNQFCRGKVKEINLDGIIVEFVDFGYTKNCRAKDLRKKIILSDIPLQIIKCNLYQTVPKFDKWPKNAVQYLRNSILNNVVTVQVKSYTDENIYVIIKVDEDNYNEMLIDRGWGVKDSSDNVSDCSVIIEDSVSKGGSTPKSFIDIPSYRAIILPPTTEKFKVEVVSVGNCGPLSWYLSLKDNMANVIAEKLYYDEIFEQMQEEAPFQPMIEKPEVGQPCCALFEEDSRWYRAEILPPIFANSDTFVVLFVDYGNVDTITRPNIRYIKPEWLNVPLQCISCELANVRVGVPGENEEELTDLLSDVLFEQNCFAEIVETEPLKVHLYDENGKLKYQTLIDENVLILE